MDHYAKTTQKQIKAISKEAMNLLFEYDWPGNVRELENAIERAVIMADQEVLTTQDFPDYLREEITNLIKRGLKGRRSLDEIKDEYITEILKETSGNKRMAAEILKVNPRTLYRFERRTQPKLDS